MTTKSDSLVLPLILSLLVHIALVALLFFWQPAKPVIIPSGIQTELIGADELAAIEGQIRENAKLAAQAMNAPSQAASAMQAYNEDLAKRQAEFRQQMAQFAAEQDAEAIAAMQAMEDEYARQYQEQQQALASAKAAFDNHDQIIKKNQDELNEARIRRDEIIKDAEKQAQLMGGTNGSLSSGQANQPNVSGTNATKNSSSSSNNAGLGDAIRRHIERHWNTNALTGSVTAIIDVDSQGNVKAIRFSNSNSPLVPTLEQAIRAASPITPVVGKNITTVRVNFSTD